jgi:hypothetical protein
MPSLPFMTILTISCAGFGNTLSISELTACSLFLAILFASLVVIVVFENTGGIKYCYSLTRLSQPLACAPERPVLFSAIIFNAAI